MLKITVVIPVYNAEKYIAEALDSLIAQTFTDWECVIVNDGSTDDSLGIIRDYAAREPRIRYESIANSGSAKVPRDRAISMAQGEWIIGLDADDKIDPQLLQQLIDRQEQTQADMVLPRMIRIDEQGCECAWRVPRDGFDFSAVLSGGEAALLTIGDWQIGANGGLLSKAILNGRQTATNHMNADEYDTRQMLLSARTVAFVASVYYYRFNRESITKKVSYKQFETLITDKMLVDLFAAHFGQNSPEHRLTQKVFLRRLFRGYKTYSRVEKQLSVADRLKVKELILSLRKQVTNREVIHSDLSFMRKGLLLLPNSMLFAIGRII